MNLLAAEGFSNAPFVVFRTSSLSASQPFVLSFARRTPLSLGRTLWRNPRQILQPSKLSSCTRAHRNVLRGTVLESHPKIQDAAANILRRHHQRRGIFSDAHSIVKSQRALSKTFHRIQATSSRGTVERFGCHLAVTVVDLFGGRRLWLWNDGSWFGTIKLQRKRERSVSAVSPCAHRIGRSKTHPLTIEDREKIRKLHKYLNCRSRSIPVANDAPLDVTGISDPSPQDFSRQRSAWPIRRTAPMTEEII